MKTWNLTTAVPTHVLFADDGHLTFIYWRKKELSSTQREVAEALRQAGLSVAVTETGDLDNLIPWEKYVDGKRETKHYAANTVLTQASRWRSARDAALRMVDCEERRRVVTLVKALESRLAPYGVVEEPFETVEARYLAELARRPKTLEQAADEALDEIERLAKGESVMREMDEYFREHPEKDRRAVQPAAEVQPAAAAPAHAAPSGDFEK